MEKTREKSCDWQRVIEIVSRDELRIEQCLMGFTPKELNENCRRKAGGPHGAEAKLFMIESLISWRERMRGKAWKEPASSQM